MRLSLLLRSLLIALFLVTGIPTLAWADGPTPGKVSKSDKQEAAKLKKEADGLMGADRYADALSLYQKAYDITGDPALLYNQGRAYEAMGEYPDAVDKLTQFDKDASPALHAKVPALQTLINDLKSRIAVLVVTTNATGARLLVRDKALGTITGEMKIRTRAGPASVEVSADGYNTFKKDVDLTAGTTVKVEANLELKKSDAVIVVHSKPIADIQLDGKAIGRVPLEFHAAAGRHTLTADADGYEAESVPMTLALGDRRELEIELHKSPSIFKRWWFWTAVGVVVAGGVATYLALTIEKPVQAGNFGNNGLLTAP